MTRKVNLMLVVGVLLAVAPLSASTIVLPSDGVSVLETVFDSVSFRLFTQSGNGNVDNDMTFFTPPGTTSFGTPEPTEGTSTSGAEKISSVTGLEYVGYLPGAMITGATLDYDGTFGRASVSPQLTSKGTAGVFDTPTFTSSGLSSYEVVISSPNHSVTVSGESGSGYDLWANGFSDDIVAGHPITIQWQANDQFSAVFDKSPGCVQDKHDVLKCYEVYKVTDTRTLTASAFLHLTVSDPPGSVATPEPATMLLGGSMIGLAVLLKRFAKR